MGRAVALAIAVLLLVPAFAGAQAVTRGSPLTATPNVPFGCEAKVSLPPLGSDQFVLAPAGLPSCSWWSTGPAAAIGDPNTGYVPTTGTITNVRVRSGPQPAALRLVQLRSVAGCCTVVRHTEPFQPAPNSVTQVTVNWLTEVVRDSVVGVSTNDIIGFSAVGGAGTLPLSDQGTGTHSSQAAFTPGVMGAGFTSPMGQPGALIAASNVGAYGYEVLLQYDFVPCPALNNVPVAPGTLTCPGQNTVTTPGANAAPTAPPSSGVPGVNPISFPRGFNARLQGINVPLSLICSLDIGCSGTVRLALALGAGTARSAKTVTLGTKKFKIKKGRHQVKVKLGKKSRARLRKKKSTTVTAVVTVAGMPTLRTTLKVRR